MKKFIPYSGDAFQLYSDALARSGESKRNVLNLIDAQVRLCYEEYKYAFERGNVHNITPHCFNESQKEELKSMYSSGAAVVRELRDDYELRNNKPPNRVYYHICPYCGFTPSGTMEHILPKGRFPEYAIHALNLIPCCGDCNSSKGSTVKEDGFPCFFNFYYNNPEESQFLYATFTTDHNGCPDFDFSIHFEPDATELFQKIVTSHFEKLHLLARFKVKCISEFDSWLYDILSQHSCNSVDEIIDGIKDNAKIAAMRFGRNHYKSVMLYSISESPIFKSYLTEKLNEYKKSLGSLVSIM